MNELIKITDQNGKKIVSARELHSFLENKERFSKWINRMLDYGFIIDHDYTPYQIVHPQNNQIFTDYALTIDTAKEIAMIQRSEKGKLARQYFIECERKLQEQKSKFTSIDLSDPNTVLKLAQNWKEEHDKRKKLEQENFLLLEQTNRQTQELIKQAPKINYVNNVLDSQSTYPITAIAKELGMSAKKLNVILHNKGVQYKISGAWVLYSKYQNKGYTKTKTVLFTSSDGQQKTSMRTVWTERGRAFIHKLISNNF